MKYVCVLDMDETLGFFHQNVFHVRPKVNVLIHLLKLLKVDIIIWSLGEDNYVKDIMNQYLPEIARLAFKIFARQEAYVSKHQYNFWKASEHIRIMYEEPIYLLGIDDRVTQNMDSKYDFRISVSPYDASNLNDIHLLTVCEDIIECFTNIYKAQENEQEIILW